MISAILFDLDGTVFDNEGIWEEVFASVVTSRQLKVQQQTANGWIHEPGIGVVANWEKLVGKSQEITSLVGETWTKYWDIVGDVSSLPVRQGLVELVEQIKEQGWQTALVTSSEWHEVEKELEQVDLYLAFDVTTTVEEVLLPKPAPDLFLATAQKMGLEPAECVVIEDSLAGVRAAVESGMRVVGLASGYASRQQLEKAGVNLVVDNLNEVVVGLAEHGNQD
ncbi:MAG: HAD family phosphatase [bacterium]|nr:HAD family phosphatase [bacterium]